MNFPMDEVTISDVTNRQDTGVKDWIQGGKDRSLSVHTMKHMYRTYYFEKVLGYVRWEGSRQISDVFLSYSNAFLDAHGTGGTGFRK